MSGCHARLARRLGLVGAVSCGLWAVAPAAHAAGRLPAALVALRAPSAPTNAPTYRFRTLRFPGSVGSEITGINAHGAYTGQVGEKTGVLNFTNSGLPGAKPFFLRPPTSYRGAQTSGIDNAGAVVGIYVDGAGVNYGFIRTPNRVYTSLSIPGAGMQKDEGTQIAGISPGGVIVGSYVASTKVGTGFIDVNGHITTITVPLAGHLPSDGTQVNFYFNGEYGGFFVEADGSTHGWYIQNGVEHIVDDPLAGPPQAGRGTELVGVDARGRLYGVESPHQGPSESFSLLGGRYHVIRDPQQTRVATSSTTVLGVSPSGVVAGFYNGPRLFQHAFIGHPR